MRSVDDDCYEVGDYVVIMTNGPWQGKTGRVVKLYTSGRIGVTVDHDATDCKAFKASSLRRGTKEEFEAQANKTRQNRARRNPPTTRSSKTSTAEPTTPRTRSTSSRTAPVHTPTRMDEDEDEVSSLRKENKQMKGALRDAIVALAKGLGEDFATRCNVRDDETSDNE